MADGNKECEKISSRKLILGLCPSCFNYCEAHAGDPNIVETSPYSYELLCQYKCNCQSRKREKLV